MAAVSYYVPRLQHYARLFSTSLHLRFGVAYIEAMAGGVPAIGCRGEDGPEEIAASGHGIRLVAPGDPEDLARAIRHLHDDPARREGLARNGRRAEQELGWSVQRQKYLGVFDALMRRG